MTCPTCGQPHGVVAVDPAAEVAIAEAATETAAVHAETEQVVQAEVTERNEDDNDTREAIARIEADAQVEQTRILADAAVDIAEAEAAADVAAAEVIADEEPDGDEMPPDGADVELEDDGDEPAELDEDVEPTPIAVPPQIAEDRPAPTPKSVQMSRFRGRKHRR